MFSRLLSSCSSSVSNLLHFVLLRQDLCPSSFYLLTSIQDPHLLSLFCNAPCLLIFSSDKYLTFVVSHLPLFSPLASVQLLSHFRVLFLILHFRFTHFLSLLRHLASNHQLLTSFSSYLFFRFLPWISLIFVAILVFQQQSTVALQMSTRRVTCTLYPTQKVLPGGWCTFGQV